MLEDDPGRIIKLPGIAGIAEAILKIAEMITNCIFAAEFVIRVETWNCI